MAKIKYANAYRVFVSGMVNGICFRVLESFDVGAKNEKQAIQILRVGNNKTAKYSVYHKHATDLGIPIGRFVRRN